MRCFGISVYLSVCVTFHCRWMRAQRHLTTLNTVLCYALFQCTMRHISLRRYIPMLFFQYIFRVRARFRFVLGALTHHSIAFEQCVKASNLTSIWYLVLIIFFCPFHSDFYNIFYSFLFTLLWQSVGDAGACAIGSLVTRFYSDVLCLILSPPSLISSMLLCFIMEIFRSNMECTQTLSYRYLFRRFMMSSYFGKKRSYRSDNRHHSVAYNDACTRSLVRYMNWM